jgi:hypothetical protein
MVRTFLDNEIQFEKGSNQTDLIPLRRWNKYRPACGEEDLEMQIQLHL